MRRLLANGALWGAYGQLVAVTGPIFTGFALYMGLEAADIALIASVVALAGLVQPISSLITGRLRNQKGFVIRFGLIEITLTTCVILIPLATDGQSVRFALTATATLAGTLTGNLVAPLFNSWFSTVLPEEARARFMGRRLVLVNLAAMAVGYGAGQFIDLAGRGHVAFVVPYAVAWLVGVGGYWALSRIPFPSILRVDGEISFDRALAEPFRNRRFRRLLLFYLTWVFGVLIADPFYNVFMIRDLNVDYATIGVFNAIVLAVGIAGYQAWGGAAGRFGCKPVLELLMVPRLVLPFVWILLTPANHRALLYVIMVFNGLVFSGLTVAVNTLLFGSIPEEGDRSSFFAVWAFSTSLVTSAATALGGLIVRNFSDVSINLFGFGLGGIKIAFALSGALMIVPVILLQMYLT